MIIFPGAVIGGALPVDVTLRDTANATTDATSHTFTGMALGAADTRRYILVGVGYSSLSAGVTVTIAGNTAPLVSGTQAVSGVIRSEMHLLAVPTGTSATIVISKGDAIIPYIAVWSCLLPNATAYDTATSASDNPSLSLNTRRNGGFAVLAMSNGVDLTGFSWSGVTEDFEVGVSGARYSGGSSETTVTGSRSVSATISFAPGGGIGATATSAVSF
jgi:hypothetical protein